MVEPDEIQRFTELAMSISDGVAVDWKQVEKATTGEREQLLVRELRLVADIALVHRSRLADRRDEPALMIGPGRVLSHYLFVEKVGEGGMGVVWKAKDTTLHRTVAIKVLPAEATRDETRRRMFLREARLASSVSDAHIAQVYELGRDGDLDFIVMEYVEGKPLSRLVQGRALDPGEVVSLGEQVARALARAHQKGLLHRDVKPGNILVTLDGEAKVVDFGLATLFAGLDVTSNTEATTLAAPPQPVIETSGSAPSLKAAIMGTVPYMSPEQVRGETLDARSDIFSLGSVLFEMTTGSRPFLGTTGAEVMEEILKGRPIPIHDSLPKVSPDLVRIIRRAMEPDRCDRYQTMEELAVELKRLGRQMESGNPEASTIMIWPLEVRGQFGDNQYAGIAFSEAVAVGLAQVRTLKVLPVSPAEINTSSDPLAQNRAAMALGAGRLLKGSLTHQGESIRANLTLVDPDQNRVLWGGQKDGTTNDLPRLASMMAQQVGLQLGVVFPRYYDTALNLMGGEEMSLSPLSADALGALKRFEISVALQATKRLVEEFPAERDALVLRAAALDLAWDKDRALTRRKELEQSIALLDRTDPNNPYGEMHRAYLLVAGDRKPKEALEKLTNLLTRSDFTPSLRAAILAQRSSASKLLGHLDSALADLEVARSLDPVNTTVIAHLSAVLAPLGRAEEATDLARQWVALAPSYWKSHYGLGWVLLILGRWEESLGPLRESCRLGQNQEVYAHYAYALMRNGNEQEALAAGAKAAVMEDSIPGTYLLASLWALAGRRIDALLYLRRSLKLGFARPHILSDPDMDFLRGDPEFEAIVAEVKSRLAGLSG